MSAETELQVVRMHRLEGESKLKAFVDVAISGFVVTGLRIVEGKNGLFIGMPQEKAKDGKWYNSFYPANKDSERQLSEVVINAYQQ